MVSDPSRSEAILRFWFGTPECPHPDGGRARKAWFAKDLAFDAAVRAELEPDYRQAATGKRQSWQGAPRSCLALILLLDQVPRQLFRGQPRAYATDPQALAAAQHAVEQGYDRTLLPVQRWFVYMPFEHAENLATQNRAVALFSTLEGDPQSARTIAFAHRHRRVIERFGRFPHRNAILGRPSTPQEQAFLAQPGSSL